MTTQVPDAPPLANPDPTQPPEGIEETPQLPPEQADTPAQGEEQEQGAELQQVELPEGWQETEAAKAYRQQVQSDKDKEWGRKSREAQMQAIQERDRAVNAALSGQVVSQVSEAVASFNDKIGRLGRDGTVDLESVVDDLGSLLRKNQPWAQVFNTEVQRYDQSVGRDAGIDAVYGRLFQGLPKPLFEDLSDYVTDEVNPAIMGLDQSGSRAQAISREEAIDRILARRDELVANAAKAQVEAAVAVREKAEGKAEKRQGEKPPVNFSGRGTSGGLTAQRIVAMSDDEREKHRSEIAAFLKQAG